MSGKESIGPAHDKAAITFVDRGLAGRWPDIQSVDAAALEREQARFRRGIDNWVIQTYVRLAPRLRAMGFDVSIRDRFVRETVCVAHRDDLNDYADPLHACYVVGLRADRPPLRVAQLEVHQNGLDLGARARFIPHWPQPGLIPRDPARGDRAERVVYLGRAASVPPWYSDGRLEAGLAGLGMRLEIREQSWNDYSEVDVCIAHRDESPTMLASKPASKLVNAWLAGVPAVLAPEPAYRELRNTPLDFLQTHALDDTLAAMRRLHEERGLYRAMVENGRQRAHDFTLEAMEQRWAGLLGWAATEGFAQWRAHRAVLPLRYAATVAAMSRQKMLAKAFRRSERAELRVLRAGP